MSVFHTPPVIQKIPPTILFSKTHHHEATELLDEFTHTAVGEALKAAVDEANRSGASKSWFSLLSAIPSSKLKKEPLEPLYDHFAHLDNIVHSQSGTWHGSMSAFEPRPVLNIIIQEKDWKKWYDTFWAKADLTLWKEATRLEDTPGSLGKLFGLFPPNQQSSRPTYSKAVFKELESKRVQEERRQLASTVESVPYVSSIPTATPQDSIAKAPARVSDEPKVKKTRAQSRKKGLAGLVEGPDQVEHGDESHLPDLLPSDFNLSRKNAEVREQNHRDSTPLSYAFCRSFIESSGRRRRVVRFVGATLRRQELDVKRTNLRWRILIRWFPIGNEAGWFRDYADGGFVSPLRSAC